MTLFECCVSAAILGGAAMAVTPSLTRARANYELDGQARQIASQLQYTRIKAVSRNQDCRMRIVTQSSYVVECQDLTWRADQLLVLPPGFRIAANATPAFHRRGNVSPAATISVSDVTGRTKQIVINITGRVRVQ